MKKINKGWTFLLFYMLLVPCYSDFLKEYFGPNLGIGVNIGTGAGFEVYDKGFDKARPYFKKSSGLVGQMSGILSYNRYFGAEFNIAKLGNDGYYRMAVLGQLGVPLYRKFSLRGRLGYGVSFIEYEGHDYDARGLVYGASLEYKINAYFSLTCDWLRNTGGNYKGVVHVPGAHYVGIGVTINRFWQDK